MPTQIPASGIAPGAITAEKIAAGAVTAAKVAEGVAGGPKISTVAVTNNSYTVLDDTAVDTSGGYIKITGTGFASGCSVVIGTTAATATTFISSTEVRAQVPAQSAGSYFVYVVNPDGGTATRVNGLTYSASPTWTTASALPNATSNVAYTQSLVATGATSYSLQAGSSLPSGMTLTSDGSLSGTTVVANNTAYSFTVLATDAELQDSPRTFSLNVNTGPTDPYAANTKLLLHFNNDLTNDSASGITMIQGTDPILFNSSSKFGSHSGQFTSSAGARTSSTVQFGSDNWTVEGWFYPTAAGSQVGQAWSQGINTSNGLLGGVFTTGVFFRSNNQTDTQLTNLSLGGAWHHIAWVRIGNTVYIYVDGQQAVSGSYSNSMTDSNYGFSVGPNSSYTGANTAFNFAGYIDDFRITQGVGRYSGSTITVPTQPFPSAL